MNDPELNMQSSPVNRAQQPTSRQRPDPNRVYHMRLAENRIWLGFQIGIGIMLAFVLAGPFVAVLGFIFWLLVAARIG